MIDLQRLLKARTIADEIAGIVKESGMEITELLLILQGQLGSGTSGIIMSYLFDGFAPANLKG